MTANEKYYWDSTDQENMPEIQSLDHGDLKAKNAIANYFKQLMCRMAYAEISQKVKERREGDNSPEIIDPSEADMIGKISHFTTNQTEVTEAEGFTEITPSFENTAASSEIDETKEKESLEEEKQITGAQFKTIDRIPAEDVFTETEMSKLFHDYDMKFLTNWSRTYNFHKWKQEHHTDLAYLDSK